TTMALSPTTAGGGVWGMAPTRTGACFWAGAERCWCLSGGGGLPPQEVTSAKAIAERRTQSERDMRGSSPSGATLQAGNQRKLLTPIREAAAGCHPFHRRWWEGLVP